MNLSELDRPTVTWHYERWQRDITLRPITAHQLALLNEDFGQLDGQDVGTPGALKFYASLLSVCVIDPQYSVDEWLNDASAETVKVLGMKALEVSGLIVDEAKKN